MENKVSQNIILDLDETLIHTIDYDLPDISKDINENPTLEKYRGRIYNLNHHDISTNKGSGYRDECWGIMRPYASEFLAFCFSHFDKVTVWSAGKKEYVQVVVDHLFKVRRPHCVMTYDDCDVEKSGNYSKPIEYILEAADMKKENTFFVDDRALNFGKNPGNGIIIPKYRPSPSIEGIEYKDPCLEQLTRWFMKPEVYMCKDIRSLNKDNIFTGESTNPLKVMPTLRLPKSMKQLATLEGISFSL